MRRRRALPYAMVWKPFGQVTREGDLSDDFEAKKDSQPFKHKKDSQPFKHKKDCPLLRQGAAMMVDY